MNTGHLGLSLIVCVGITVISVVFEEGRMLKHIDAISPGSLKSLGLSTFASIAHNVILSSSQDTNSLLECAQVLKFVTIFADGDSPRRPPVRSCRSKARILAPKSALRYALAFKTYAHYTLRLRLRTHAVFRSIVPLLGIQSTNDGLGAEVHGDMADTPALQV